MVNLLSKEVSGNILEHTIKAIGSNIDLAIARGSRQEETLLIMKDLLNDLKIYTSMTDYIEEETYEEDLDFYRRKNINR